MRTFRIHFIRHGLTEANADGRYIGVTDLPLSSVGIDALEALKNEGVCPNTGLVFSGPLKRCTETAEILFPGTEPVIIDEWKEYNFGEFENKSAYELENLPEYSEWTSGKLASPPGGEDPKEFTARLCAGLNRAVKKMMEIEVYEASAIMHGGVIMSLFAATALPRRRMVEWTCDAGNGYTALITPSLYGRSGIIEIIDTVPSSAIAVDDSYEKM